MVRVAAAHDQPLFARLLRSALAERGAEFVGIARSAAEALSLVAELEPDVLLLDLALPGALDVLQVLRVRGPPVQVVALASKEAADERRRAAEAGVNAFVRADAEPAEVAQALQLLGQLRTTAAGPRRAPPPSPG
jgi:DNA-binding NarL/FixJ family response regulator